MRADQREPIAKQDDDPGVHSGQLAGQYDVLGHVDQGSPVAGATIGYAKLDRFPSMRVRRIRLTIEDAVSTPEAVTIKLFA